ncbi:hypothetical protein RFI_00208 [Reticulomyxa filosa]|uniref:Uncharacterized protein n=1 Tax=Reticulomyxa filosa TaxID=46433 RepID=X6PFM8_RETFI|nr:hypothetical protein RFI_00208 [Reticulomyxa filosa]|eukprot:ETO36854.1 hypothetical protein RFI_00208 [Reticulomyxa filosa]
MNNDKVFDYCIENVSQTIIQRHNNITAKIFNDIYLFYDHNTLITCLLHLEIIINLIYDLLFTTHYPKNVEVIDLKTMKSLTGIKNNIYQKKTIYLELISLFCAIDNKFLLLKK